MVHARLRVIDARYLCSREFRDLRDTIDYFSLWSVDRSKECSVDKPCTWLLNSAEAAGYSRAYWRAILASGDSLISDEAIIDQFQDRPAHYDCSRWIYCFSNGDSLFQRRSDRTPPRSCEDPGSDELLQLVCKCTFNHWCSYQNGVEAWGVSYDY